ncbi:MAG: hypothetical protein OEW37_08785 [Rhodospirillaceae bacterium]|nr:hypothetical protein [Rhodospirillaceae bacterium]
MSENESVVALFADHSAAIRTQDLGSIEVAELGGLNIYFKPMDAYSIKEFDEMIKAERMDDVVAGYVKILMLRALKADGTKMFRPIEEKELLRKADPVLISRIIGDMRAHYAHDGSMGPEDVKKD